MKSDQVCKVVSLRIYVFTQQAQYVCCVYDILLGSKDFYFQRAYKLLGL